MPHLRKQIRDRMRDVIAIAMPGATVTSGHYHSRNLSPADVLIDVFALNERVELETMSDDRRTHETTFALRVQRVAEDGVDDLLDEDELDIRAAIFGTIWTDILLEDPEIEEVQFARATNNESAAIAALALRVVVTYRALKDNPSILENA